VDPAIRRASAARTSPAIRARRGRRASSNPIPYLPSVLPTPALHELDVAEDTLFRSHTLRDLAAVAPPTVDITAREQRAAERVEKRRARRRRHAIREIYRLRQEEEVARLQHHIKKLTAELAGEECGSSSFELLDSEAKQREERGYTDDDTDDILSEVEARKDLGKTWRTWCAAEGGLFYRQLDELSHLYPEEFVM
jgi:hypothetical protein